MKVAQGVQRAGWKPVIVFVPAFLLVFLVPSGLHAIGFDRIVSLTEGLATYTLVNTWVGTLLTIGVVAIWYGSLDLEDVGIVPSKLPVAMGVTLMCWSIYTISQVVTGLVFGDLSLYSEWIDPGVAATIGQIIGYFFGNVVFEELAFRGFLLVQLYLLLDGQWWRVNEVARIAVATVGSSLIFTLFHVPAFLIGGIRMETLAFIFVYAVLLCLVYIRTRNVFIAMGVHGLANFPVPILSVVETTPYDFSLVWAIPAAIIVVTWPILPLGDEKRTRRGHLT